MGAVEPAVKFMAHCHQPPARPRKHTPARSRPGTDHELHAATSNKQTADRGLRAGTRHEAANLCVAVAVVNGPHNGRAETVGLGYNCCVRHDQPLSIDAHTIVPIPSTSCTLKPSAKEQHKPFPLARRSNHGLSGEFANLPP